MTTHRGSIRRAVALALLAVAPLPLLAQQESPSSLLTVREIDDLVRPIAQLPDEALEQVLRLLAERPAWAIGLGRAYRQQPGDLRAAIENQRRITMAPAPVIIQQPPIVVQPPTIIVPNPVFAPPPVIVHAPPIVHVRPWGLWPWTRTIVERPIYITNRSHRDRDRNDRDDRDRNERGREDRGRDDRGRDARDRQSPVTPDRPRTAVPRASAGRTP